MGIADSGVEIDGRTPNSSNFKRGVVDRLTEHGADGGFAAAEAFKRIDGL